MGLLLSDALCEVALEPWRRASPSTAYLESFFIFYGQEHLELTTLVNKQMENDAQAPQQELNLTMPDPEKARSKGTGIPPGGPQRRGLPNSPPFSISKRIGHLRQRSQLEIPEGPR